MNATTLASHRARAAAAAVIALIYFAVAVDGGGSATTAVAWGAIIVWAIVAIGIGLRAWPDVALPRTAIAAVGCFAGLAALSALSLVWADDAGRAFSAVLLPGAYAGLALLVILASSVIPPRVWLVGIAGGATLTAIIALASRLDPGFLGTHDGAAGAFSLGAVGRLSYPIGYWNGLAACLAVGLVLQVWLASEAESRLGRAVAVGLLPIGGLALYFTSSRGGVVAAVLGIAVLAAVGPRRARLLIGAGLGAAAVVGLSIVAHGQHDLINDLRTSAQRREGLELGAAMVVVGCAIGLIRWRIDDWLSALTVTRTVRRSVLAALLVVVVAGVALSHPVRRLDEFGQINTTTRTTPGERSFTAASGNGRAQFWEAALDAFASKPITGVGADNYALYWNAHPEAQTVTGNAHSMFLDELADLGPLGLLLALGPFAAAAVAARARWGSRSSSALGPVLAMLVAASVGAVVDWTWRIPASFIPAIVAIALLTGSALRPASAGRAEGVRRLGSKAGIVTILAALGVGFTAGVVLLASAHLTSSHDAVNRDDLPAAASEARSAASIEPFSPEPQLQLALVAELAGNLGQAGAAAQAAIDNAPGDWRGWAIAARIDRESGHLVAAFKADAKAQSLSPVPLPRVFTSTNAK